MRTFSVAVNGRIFKAKAGEVLLNAALSNGVSLPHDCRSGVCGTCLTRVVKGTTILGNGPTPGTVYACKARILSHLEIETEEVPEAAHVKGFLKAIRVLGPDVFEVTIKPEKRVHPLPGQYFKFKFEGYPLRNYSATRPLEGRPKASTITLQVRRYQEGRVSSQLGRRIKPGHPVKIEGPYGSAFFRAGKTNRLVLISNGTGFAPIWGIACAALRENIERKIILIAGVRTADCIYMAAALERLASFPNVDVVVTIGRRSGLSEYVRQGYPTDHLPSLDADDIVYACGPVQMIETLSPIVTNAGAQFHCDPFEPATESGATPLLETARSFLERVLRQEEQPRRPAKSPIWRGSGGREVSGISELPLPEHPG